MTNKQISQEVEILHIENQYYFVRINNRALKLNLNDEKIFIQLSEKEKREKQLLNKLQEFEKAKKTMGPITLNSRWRQIIKTLEAMIINIEFRFMKERQEMKAA